VWGRLVATFRARLLALPSKLAGRLVGISEARAIHGRIESEVYDALTELSDEGRLVRAAKGDSERDSQHGE
jgi:hypothetical protein